jgi:pimeloyl-ACP methyl ester carboxylesterase
MLKLRKILKVITLKLTSRVMLISAALTLVACSHPRKKITEGQPRNDHEAVFKSSIDGINLHGTLSINSTPCRAPVLLITGSGKVDRNETTEANRTYSGKQEKLFKQISDKLVRSGFCTFRYDKRGVLDDKGNVDSEIWLTADREHLISDAVDASKFLLKETHFEPKELILLGHSEGTIIAVETAIRLGGTIKGLLLLGLQARSLKEMLHYQIVESRSRQSSGIGKESSPGEEYLKALTMIESSKENFAPDGKPMAWYRQYLLAPANEMRVKEVKGTIAVFQGEIDPQTPIEEVDRFLKNRPDIWVYRYPNLGHGFSPDLNGSPTLGPIDSKVLEDIAKAAQKF